MTLNGVMAVILPYFSEFGYLPGVLRRSSRSLSHLLMSSCFIYHTTLVSTLTEIKIEQEYHKHLEALGQCIPPPSAGDVPS